MHKRDILNSVHKFMVFIHAPILSGVVDFIM